MIKLALGVEYDGSFYCGWQYQPGLSSVQGNLEHALSKIADEDVTVFCAGRTDTGVHAYGQVLHFEVDKFRANSAWTFGVNRYLPSSISVKWSLVVNKNFHARFSAISRRYCYFIYNDKFRPAILNKKVNHYSKILDVNRMMQAGQCLLGENDFSSFRSMHCQSLSSRRYLYHLFVFRQGKYVIIDIKANAFMYHMVRNIVGHLLEVGCGNRSVNWIAELLAKCQSSLSTYIVPAHGLYLVEVEYPKHFNIPSEKLMSLILV